MKTRFTFFCVLMSVLLCSSNVFARRVYVRLATDATAWSHVTQDDNNKVVTLPEGSTDFTTQYALGQLLAFDEVWVTKGEYTNSAKLTLLNDENAGYRYGNITLYGGFAGTETDIAQRALADKDGNGLTEAWEFVNETIFRGAGNSTDTPSDFQLMQLGTSSVLDGVTLSENYFTGAASASGGVVGATATLRNSIVRNVTTDFTGATINGGGLYVTGGHVENCLIESCKSMDGVADTKTTCHGGGIHANGMTGDNIDGEPTGWIKNCMIRSNEAGVGVNQGRGGGIFGRNGILIENCVIHNNQTGYQGGGFHFHKVGDTKRHVNRVIGCTVVNNVTNKGTQIVESAYVEFYNSIIYGNANTSYPGTVDAYANTFRLFNNTSADIPYPYLDAIAMNGTIQSAEYNRNTEFSPVLLNSLDGTGVLIPGSEGADPMFTKTVPFLGAALSVADLREIQKANFTLKEGSSLIEAGLNEPSNKLAGYNAVSSVAVFSGVDLMGAERNVGDKFDIGAYEYGAEYPKPNTLPAVSESNHRILVSDGQLSIVNLDAPAIVQLFSANGALISIANTTSSSINLPLEGRGFYIVILTVNNKTYSQKVVL